MLLMLEMRKFVIQNLPHHCPSRDRKTGSKGMLLDIEAGDFIKRVGHNFGPLGKMPHLYALLVFRQRHITAASAATLIVLTKLGNQPLCLWMQGQRHPQRLSGSLACLVIGGRPNAPTAKYNVISRKATL